MIASSEVMMGWRLDPEGLKRLSLAVCVSAVVGKCDVTVSSCIKGESPVVMA